MWDCNYFFYFVWNFGFGIYSNNKEFQMFLLQNTSAKIILAQIKYDKLFDSEFKKRKTKSDTKISHTIMILGVHSTPSAQRVFARIFIP
ncbi:hypothetical protein CON47_07820 [Bacillus thuringiensis]|nr:hypothetical protein CON47_07820 [Bacillus thuringiensis]